MTLQEEIKNHNKEVKARTDFDKKQRYINQSDLDNLLSKNIIKGYHSDDTYTILNGDCMKVLGYLETQGVIFDHVISDIPYGTVQGLSIEGWKNNDSVPEWDSVINPMDMYDHLFNITKSNANIVLFCQEPFTFELLYNLQVFQKFKLSNKMIWVKNNHANGFSSKTTPLNYYEEMLLIRKHLDESNSIGIRKYFKDILDFIGKSRKEIVDGTNQGLDHCFRYTHRTFYLPTEKNYELLIEKYNIDKMAGFRSYQDLKTEYEKDNDVIFNLPKGQKCISNIFEVDKDINNIHPTQKPQRLLTSLVNIFTDEDDCVLDITCGSGSLGIACNNRKRKFVGIELDTDFYEKAWNWHLEELKRKEFSFGV